ncbi:DUF2778 domain-containing protein [Moritella yayanosii]|nr:DUF2778 domain-containing protein [Moritella yayanosii]
MSVVGDIMRRTQGDWGDWRIRLYPEKNTKTFGRDGFFIHGGDINGSAGCIDIGGGRINEISKYYRFKFNILQYYG